MAWPARSVSFLTQLSSLAMCGCEIWSTDASTTIFWEKSVLRRQRDTKKKCCTQGKKYSHGASHRKYQTPIYSTCLQYQLPTQTYMHTHRSVRDYIRKIWSNVKLLCRICHICLYLTLLNSVFVPYFIEKLSFFKNQNSHPFIFPLLKTPRPNIFNAHSPPINTQQSCSLFHIWWKLGVVTN